MSETATDKNRAAVGGSRLERLVSDLPLMTVYGDGIRDDTEALQAYVSGKARLIFPDGRPFFGGAGKVCKISRPITYR